MLVKNNSGADRGRFNVLGIDGPIFTPTESLDSFKNTIALKGITPAAATHVGKFVILQEPLADGELGRAVISGVTPVKIDVTDAGHGYADVKDAVCGTLASAASGSSMILWAESGTGEKWAIVKLGGGGGLPVIPDPDIDYMLVYDSTTKLLTWIETTEACPP